MGLLAASIQGLQDQYDILGEFGRGDDGALAYLARDRSTEELVALRLEAPAPDGRASKVTVAPALSSSVPASNRSCLICKTVIRDWRRFCGDCGADLSGVEVRAEDEAQQLLDRVLQASQQNLELIGQVQRAEGGGAVYFGYERETNRIVALDLQRSEEKKGATPEYSLNVTSTLELTQIFHAGALAVEQPTVRLTADLPPAPVPAETGKVCPSCGIEYDARTRFCPTDGSVLRGKTSTEELIGEVIAERYHILSKIGQGGMGQVYLAEHVRMGRRCAIKVLKRSLSQDPGAVGRFAREAANASRINDRNVAVIYDFGESKEHGIYLAMEYVEGEVLSQILHRQRVLPIERAVRIAVQVARALTAAHKEGVVHRDLTPNNIVIGNSAEEVDLVKVVDFGIAKAMQDTGDGLTRTGFVVGTPRYMSPEQLIAEPVDGRSDLYSLGCILFEMLVGAHPFAGPDGTQNVAKRLTEPAPHPRQVNREIPAALDVVVAKTLARDPPERYQSAAEFRQALESAATQDATRKFSWRSRRRQGGAQEGASAETNKPAVTPPAGLPAATPDPYFTPSPFGATIVLEQRTGEQTPAPSKPLDEIAAMLTPASGIPQEAAPAYVFPLAPAPDVPAAAAIIAAAPERAARVTALGHEVSARSALAAIALRRGGTAIWRSISTIASAVMNAVRRGLAVVKQGVRARLPVVMNATRQQAKAAWSGTSAGGRTMLNLWSRGVTAAIRGIGAGSRVVASGSQHGMDAGVRATRAGWNSANSWWQGTTRQYRIAGAAGLVAALAGSVTAVLVAFAGPPPAGAKTTPVLLPAVLVAAPVPPPLVHGFLVFSPALPAEAEVRANGEPVVLQNDTLPLPAGDHLIEITAAGFQPLSRTVTIETGVSTGWVEQLRLDKPIAAAPSATPSATGQPRVRAPDDANAEFVRSVARELALLRNFLQNKDLQSVRPTVTARELENLRSVFAAAGTAPISVELQDVRVRDSSATRATFELRIVTRSGGTTLLPATIYIADFEPLNNRWMLVFINRVGP